MDENKKGSDLMKPVSLFLEVYLLLSSRITARAYTRGTCCIVAMQKTLYDQR